MGSREYRVVYLREGWTGPQRRTYRRLESCESFVALLHKPPPEGGYDEDRQMADWISKFKPLLWERVESREVGPWEPVLPDNDRSGL